MSKGSEGVGIPSLSVTDRRPLQCGFSSYATSRPGSIRLRFVQPVVDQKVEAGWTSE